MASKPNLLITGISGLLGGNLARKMSGRFNILGTYLHNEPSVAGVTVVKLDLAGKDVAKCAALDNFSPDFVVHCAGEANVDICEKRPADAERHILHMTKFVSRLARERDAHLVTISTDAVGDGMKDYLVESDSPNPINVYGRIKVRAENYLLAEHGSSMIVRTRFYGISSTKNKSYTERLIEALKKGNNAECFSDNYCSQIYVGNLSDVLEEAMARRLSGIFNIVEDKKHSRFEYAQIVARVFGLNEKLIIPKSMATMEFPAPRPPDTSLCNAKIKENVEVEIVSTTKGLEMMKMDMRNWH